ncbi:MAG: acyltransferase family protein [Cytophagales bacterium]|nr:acyltransferase family protein [Cytophagales bacterium]
MEKERRYDLDWLRVLVFGLLIFYHVGMFYVPWGWHIKNDLIHDWMRWPMIFVNQWRLPILFVISGMGTAFALGHRSSGQFIKERFLRLAIPLGVGMLMIVPPQVYIERIVNGDFTGSYWAWWTGPAFDGVYPEGNISWHHLWFLPYLFIYSLILSPVFIWIRNKFTSNLQSFGERLAAKPGLLFVFVFPLYLYESLLEPFFNVTHNLVHDWFNFISSMTLFFYGFLLINMDKKLWEAIHQLRFIAPTVGLFAFSGELIIWFNFEDSTIIHFTEALFKTTYLWSAIITIFAWAKIYLNKPSKLISYANRAVYPFYIFHQTVTIILGYFLLQVDYPFGIEITIMVGGTFLICWVLYEGVVLRTKVTKVMFGVK